MLALLIPRVSHWRFQGCKVWRSDKPFRRIFPRLKVDWKDQPNSLARFFDTPQCERDTDLEESSCYFACSCQISFWSFESCSILLVVPQLRIVRKMTSNHALSKNSSFESPLVPTTLCSRNINAALNTRSGIGTRSSARQSSIGTTHILTASSKDFGSNLSGRFICKHCMKRLRPATAAESYDDVGIN